MKSCPSCGRTYTDDSLSFCLEDGTPLIGASDSSADVGAATIKIPAARLTSDAPTEVLGAQSATEVMPESIPRATQPVPAPITSKSYSPMPEPSGRKPSAMPWILGTALVLGLSAVAVALIMTRGGSGADNSESAQNRVQANSTTLDGSVNASNGSSANATVNTGINPSPSSAPTPAVNATAVATPARSPEQPSATPKPTPTSKPTPQPTPEATPTPRPRPSGPISGGVLNGKAISLPRPAYPSIARAARASGTVTVQVMLDESGRVASARAVSGHPLLQQSAVQAAYGARFAPTHISGQPVRVTGVLTYNFSPQ